MEYNSVIENSTKFTFHNLLAMDGCRTETSHHCLMCYKRMNRTNLNDFSIFGLHEISEISLMKFHTNSQSVSLKINCNNFCDSLTFHLVPSSGQNFNLSLIL